MVYSRKGVTEPEEIMCQSQIEDWTVRYSPRGAMVFGYPSCGGVHIQDASLVELVHLGLDRFKEAKRASSVTEEAAFCKRLGHLGASLWASRTAWTDAILGEGDLGKLAKVVRTGWPSAGKGVWVLEYDEADREMRNKGSLVNLCLNMDERCKIIEESGGTFYLDPDDCEALRPL